MRVEKDSGERKEKRRTEGERKEKVKKKEARGAGFGSGRAFGRGAGHAGGVLVAFWWWREVAMSLCESASSVDVS